MCDTWETLENIAVLILATLKTTVKSELELGIDITYPRSGEKICLSCQETKTTQWRVVWSVKEQSYLTFCNACGLRYPNNDSCFYCSKVCYRQRERDNATQCQKCHKHVCNLCLNSKPLTKDFVCIYCN